MPLLCRWIVPRLLRLSRLTASIFALNMNIESLRFGNVAASGLDAVIAPGLGETNVIGMNLLSRLASVRIEGGELILVPNSPVEPLPPAD